MKNFKILILFICCTSALFSQRHELGFFLGGTNYIGDTGRTTYIYPNEFAGGILYKNNISPRIALRANLSYFPISGDDADSNNPYRNARRNEENKRYSFTNTISELGVGIEFNFFEYRIDIPTKNFTPYILAEIAVFNYKNIADHSETSIVYNNKFSYTLPVGVGVKGKLIGRIGYAVESGVRFTLNDDLDYTTDRVPEYDFGGYGNDFYVFTGVSLIYAFGRPPCYAPLK